ncbi:MAG: heparinase II/III family protein [Alphaproteobacteria bacterium]|nr:heparinase II/III family protein [Alphaproteobacteria bacterium]MBV9695126.1 heparinase II/III family protein [Alphaproteobacteria bacterium]
MAAAAPVPVALWPEALRAALRSALRGPRVLWRRSWFYRRLLKGPLSDRIVFHPYDAMPRRLEEADALLHGKFRFAGESLEVKEGSVFEKPAPSPAWAEALHGFAWLPPLSAAGGEPARNLATALISQWLKRNAIYSEPAFSAAVLARRLNHIFAHSRMVLANSDMLWRSKVFVSLRDQSKLLARIAGEAPEGLPRFEVAAVLALSGACLADAKRLQLGLARLETEIARQILPDGGHVSRSPEELLHAYRLTTMVMDALVAISHPVTAALHSARDRMAPMLRFFRHGDGGLALFNGAHECDTRMIAGLLARDEVRGQPFGHARHSGYQRLAAARALAIMDCGQAPEGAFSTKAHAGCLAFEFSSGQHRIVVNCGAATEQRRAPWDDVLRATAAHSTLTLADTSSATILAAGWGRDLLGPRLLGGALIIESERIETPNGWVVRGQHDGYLRPFGVCHERRLMLAPQGTALTGADRLILGGNARRKDLTYAIRFHIHPDVRLSPSQGGDVILKLPNGEGWRFRAGQPVSVEESVYLGGDTLRRAEQLVLSGTLGKTEIEAAWVFEQIGRE